MEERMNAKEKTLCRLLAAALGGEVQDTAIRLEAAEVRQLLVMADRHAVLPLLYDVLKEQLSVEADCSFMTEKSRRTAAQSYRLLFLSRQVVTLLEEEGIESVVVKGSVAAAWYPVFELRKSGDIDLLLQKPEEAVRAEQVLLAHGFVHERQQTAHHHTVCVSPDGICVELHGLLAEPFDDKRVNAYLRQITPDFLAGKVKQDCIGVKLWTPSPAYHAFYLLLHMLQHFLRAGFGLKLLCDWVVLFRKGLSLGEEEQLFCLVKESKILGFAKMVTAVCVEYLGLPYDAVQFLVKKEEIKKELTEEFLLEIFEAEEFGKSSTDRMVVLRGSRWGDYVREFHHQMKLNHPKSSRCVLVWPVLWAVTLAGFLYRNRTVRGISGLAILRKAKMRGTLVEQMHLFDRR